MPKRSEAAERILENELSPQAERLASQYVEACGFTTTALFGISDYLARNGDEEGSELVNQFYLKFVEHEAKTA